MNTIVTNMSSIKVSVCVITYNHEAYIADCLKGIVEQHTDFQFEVIVSDDGSTDKTPEIIQEFHRKYPDIIVPILHGKNFGVPTKNYLCAHNAAQGKYIAHMDGDDLMFPGKLQKQTDFLDSNPDYSVVWHRTFKFTDAQLNELLRVRRNESDERNGFTTYDLRDILKLGCIAGHSTTMYRSQVRETRETTKDIYDWMFYVEFLSKGLGAVLDDYLGGYRYNSAGSLSTGLLGSTTKGLMSNHVTEVYYRYPDYRKELFMSSFIRMLINLKNRKIPCIEDLKAIGKIFVLVSPVEFYLYYRNIKKLMSSNIKILR